MTSTTNRLLELTKDLRRNIHYALSLAAVILLNAAASAAGAGLQPAKLECEYLVNPPAIDDPHPRLNWIVASDERGQRQTAYQILVASDETTLARDKGNLWDTGKVKSDQTIGLVYDGKGLGSRQQCFWKVKVWDKDDKPSAWSPTASWGMGLLKSRDWQADYISFRDTTPMPKVTQPLTLPPARQYRKEFESKKSVRRATIYATALGIYELHLNGRRVGDAYFAPGWTDYHVRAYYNAYDVTAMLTPGANALGAWLADGWYSGYIGFGLLTGLGTEGMGRFTYGKTPALMAQLEIEYADGSRQVVVTDNSWKVTGAGPIQEADFLMGERYDARKEMAGWAKAGFDDSKWEPAIRAEDNPPVKARFYEFQNPPPGANTKVEGRDIELAFHRPDKLEAFPGLPVRAIAEIKPIAITSPTNDVYIFNLGQNFAGVARLKVKGPAGTKIRLRYGEMLHPDGRLMTENLRKARAIDVYTLRGDAEGETFSPRFTFHGFQYVEITGYPGTPDTNAITGIVLHSDLPMTSGFECSDPMVNRLFKNIVWTQRANFLDLPTDCPQRDERFGWTGDAQVYARAGTYNMGAAAFYSKWLRELMESQRPSGTFPGYAPYPFQHGLDFGTAWCDAGVIVPWTVYKAYGDTRVIERCWEPMTKFIAWREKESKDNLGVAHGNEWGDWLALTEKTPLEYIDTAYFAYSTRLMVEMATAIGKQREAAKYQELFDRIKAAYNAKYVNADGSLKLDTQTAYALALYMDLLPENLRAAAGERLAKKIEKNDWVMGTGFIGTRPLLPVLTGNGQNNLAVRLLQTHKYPSWGYEIEQGATTIWERWNSFTKDKGFGGEQNAAMNSFSHYAFGAVCEWMFTQLAGIDSDGAGYKRILIRPNPPAPDSNPEQKPIDWVRAHYDSIRGRISSDWKSDGGKFELTITIPANTTATVYVPAADRKEVSESGNELSKAKGVKFLRQDGDRVVLAVESGTYHFTATTKATL